MRLKSLEIVGFKSFADPFRIDFRKGISSIVGPNGCGKSNVADALRWVLGTQSPRQLRTEKMESVIFSGSSARKPMGMAEVTITFDNSDRSLNLDYDEVSVSRRLFRSGESEYAVNGSRCRLMDITDLVVDRGLGSTGYWILESRMVGRILSSRPEDRRFLFDEAAGIVKYKIQRHRAELKLESAGTDLNRLSDIISEVETTCSGLKRQVSAYRRHEKVSLAIRQLREASAMMESTELRSRLGEYSRELEETGASVGKETALLAARSAVLAEARTEYGRVQARLDEAHGLCAELDSQLAALDREAAVTEQKIESAGVRIAENTARSARERERSELYSRDMESLRVELDSLAPVVSDLEEKKRHSLEHLASLEGELEKARGSAAAIKGERAELEEQAAKLEELYLEEVRRREALSRRAEWLRKSISDMKDAADIRREELSGLLSRKAGLQELAGAAEGRREAVRKEMDTLEESIRERSGELASLEKEAAVLSDKVERTRTGLAISSSPESISARVKPSPGMGKAIGAFFHGFHSALLLEAISLPEVSGGALYAGNPSQGAPLLPEGAITLDTCVDDHGGNDLLAAILRNGVLAPDRETAAGWIRAGCRLPVVTRRGDLFRPEGFLRLGVSPDSAGSLELEQILQETETALEDKRKKLEEVTGSLGELREELDSRRLELERAGEEKQGLERELAALGSSLASAEKSITEHERDIETASKELEQCGTPGEGPEDHEAPEGMESLKERREEILSREGRAMEAVSALESRAAEAAREADAAGYLLKEKENRRREITDRISMLGSERERIDDLIEELSRSSEEFTRSVTDMENKLRELGERTGELRSSRGEGEERRNGYAAERNRLMESTAVLEREVQQIRDRLSRARSRMIELEARASSISEKLEALEGSCSPEENPFADLPVEEIRSRLSSENEKLERIGPVNMLAVKEYDEAYARLSYLTEQKRDLEDARASLARAIREINEEAAERFRETFEKVRDNFRTMFVKLFGGGEGDIYSLEGDDPLEGGIEIMARPHGKKLKSVISLSEGEKAMTAVALLFSLYLVKPSPFCVLDELDAPFDDSNIDKFISILREFSSGTQFIVITHNKRTMEGSDVLYGITMAEEGVSSITSVNMEEMARL
ncbi:MAG TPA: AAA family ATPase [Candidatus Sabulitectum sp.]|nr:AAA family ATPase [Candidatus Sabulitectum sp.]